VSKVNTTNLLIGKGIDNLHDKINIGDFDDQSARIVNVLSDAQNVDLDTAGMARRRAGRTPKLLTTSPHSLWSNPLDDSLAYFVQDSVLKKLSATYTASTVATLSNNQRVSFAAVNAEIVLSNGTDIGWLDQTQYIPFNPVLGQFEKAMPAGQYVAFFRGCLFVASGSVLYVSKPYNAEIRDERFSEFPMDGYIRMLAPVEDGLWIATEKHVSFMQGKGQDEFDFIHKSDFVPPDGCFGYGFSRGIPTSEMIVWWAADGFITGKAGGAYVNLSQEQVRLPFAEKGYCFRKEDNGFYQYVAVLQNTEQGNIFVPASLPVSTTNY
jgi:hypothetical protein